MYLLLAYPLTLLTLTSLFSSETQCLPIHVDYKSKFCPTCPIEEATQKMDLSKKEIVHKICPTCPIEKKNVFVSRGWAAGGMPFSVLYMNRSYTSKAPAAATVSTQRNEEKTVQPVKPNIQTETTRYHRRRPFRIPMVFRSYDWTPLGK